MNGVSAALDPYLDTITRALVEGLQPRRVWLFGSRARGEGEEWSDYDILVEMETDLPRRERVAQVRSVVDGLSQNTDFLVLTPEEFERQRDDVGTTAYHIHREGRVLYRAPGVGLEAAIPSPHVSEGPRKPPRSLPGWIWRAENDLRIMEQSLVSGAPVWDAICFHAHQTSEKLLKSMLVATHTPFRRIHSLATLLGQCPPELRANESLVAACKVLDDLLPASRYSDELTPPPMDWMPGAEEGTRAVHAAREIRKIVSPVLARWQA
jgi:HEPN domain-containing protein/predicted nucleotidyltransferase